MTATSSARMPATANWRGYTDGRTKRRLKDLMFTGDRGRCDQSGRLFIDGRDDDMIISGGENVFPSNIERELLAHPAVDEAVVVGVPDPDLGQRIRAVVVPVSDGSEPKPTASGALTRQLKAHLTAGLARYEVPREYIYVTELPRTTTGKVRRNELLGSRAQLKKRWQTERSGEANKPTETARS